MIVCTCIPNLFTCSKCMATAATTTGTAVDKRIVHVRSHTRSSAAVSPYALGSTRAARSFVSSKQKKSESDMEIERDFEELTRDVPTSTPQSSVPSTPLRTMSLGSRVVDSRNIRDEERHEHEHEHEHGEHEHEREHEHDHEDDGGRETFMQSLPGGWIRCNFRTIGLGGGSPGSSDLNPVLASINAQAYSWLPGPNYFPMKAGGMQIASLATDTSTNVATSQKFAVQRTRVKYRFIMPPKNPGAAISTNQFANKLQVIAYHMKCIQDIPACSTVTGYADSTTSANPIWTGWPTVGATFTNSMNGKMNEWSSIADQGYTAAQPTWFATPNGSTPSGTAGGSVVGNGPFMCPNTDQFLRCISRRKFTLDQVHPSFEIEMHERQHIWNAGDYIAGVGQWIDANPVINYWMRKGDEAVLLVYHGDLAVDATATCHYMPSTDLAGMAEYELVIQPLVAAIDTNVGYFNPPGAATGGLYSSSTIGYYDRVN